MEEAHAKATSNTVTVGTIDCTKPVRCCAPCWTLLGRVATPFWTRLLPGAVAGTGRAHQSAPDHHGQAERPDQTGSNPCCECRKCQNDSKFTFAPFKLLSYPFCFPVLYTNLWICCSYRSTSTLQTSFDTRIGQFGKTLLHLGDIRTNSVATSLAACQIQAAHEAVGLGWLPQDAVHAR